MPLFYLHVCNGTGFVEDDEGTELDDLDAARRAAIEGLRDILAADIREGEVNVASFIEIEDEAHRHLATVHFADAVTLNEGQAREPR